MIFGGVAFRLEEEEDEEEKRWLCRGGVEKEEVGSACVHVVVVGRR